MKEWHCFKFLQISALSGFTEDGRILPSASALNRLLPVVSVEGDEENWALYTCHCKRTGDPLIGLGAPSGDPLATLENCLDREHFLEEAA